MKAIKINNLSKIYKDKTRALNELSLVAEQGEIFALLGPNGAGKSSLINSLTTFIQPTSGKITILGKDLTKDIMGIRQKIACVAQKNSIDEHLTLPENMIFQGRLYRMDMSSIKEKMNLLIRCFGLQNYASKRVISYSGGIKRRLDIAMSMMSTPEILFLDEPTVGMDIESRHAMWALIRQISREFHTTVFLTTHYLKEADNLSDTICIMQKGHEIIQDTPENLKRYTSQQNIRISCNSPEIATSFAKQLACEEFVHETFCLDSTLTVLVKDIEQNYNQIIRLALDGCIPQTRIEIACPSLDDVFLTLTHERSN